MATFLQVTPVLHVPDIEKAVAFYTGIFGFKAYVQASAYAYLQRDSAGLRLMSYSPGDAEMPRGDRRTNVYIDVKDVDRLYAQCKSRLDELGPGNVDGPRDAFYGQRELRVVAPDGNILVFGHAIHPANTVI